MKIKSFGCSFTFGSDLQLIDQENNKIGDSLSTSTWPLLMANHYQVEFENYAWPGIGNLRILEQILTQAELIDTAFFIINWTWIDRFDFIDPLYEAWNTLRPGDNTKLHNIYYKRVYHQYHTMLTNASYILTAINILNSKNIPFCMTLMDTTLFDAIDPNWQDPYALRILQQSIKPYITWFDNMDFLSWSRQNNYPISEAWHPLEEAHVAASEYMIKVFDKQNINVRAR
jgi:hypothetical protein